MTISIMTMTTTTTNDDDGDYDDYYYSLISLNFWGTPIISGTSKTTDFKFCRIIHRVDRNKSP